MNKKIKIDPPTIKPKKDILVKKESTTHKTKSTHAKTHTKPHTKTHAKAHTKSHASTALEVEEHSTELVPSEKQEKKSTPATPEQITPTVTEKTTSAKEKLDQERPTPAPASPELTEPAEPAEKPTETDKEIAEKIHTQASLKEKLIDRQLEMLWANGRKQLLNQPPQHIKTIPPYPDNSATTEAAHKPIKQ